MKLETSIQKTLDIFTSRYKQSANGCWIWKGACHPYGTIMLNGKQTRAHVASYLLFKGFIPPGLEVMHLCQNYRCVNPDHLKAATHLENLRHDRLGILRKVCKRGHALEFPNVYWVGKNRCCKKCFWETRNRYVRNNWRKILDDSNLRRRRGPWVHPSECKHGHPWIPENWYIDRKTGYKSCQICRKLRHQRNGESPKIMQQYQEREKHEHRAT